MSREEVSASEGKRTLLRAVQDPFRVNPVGSSRHIRMVGCHYLKSYLGSAPERV
jgi:hypothetical protein